MWVAALRDDLGLLAFIGGVERATETNPPMDILEKRCGKSDGLGNIEYPTRQEVPVRISRANDMPTEASSGQLLGLCTSAG